MGFNLCVEDYIYTSYRITGLRKDHSYHGIPLEEYFSEEVARRYWSALSMLFDEYTWRVERVRVTGHWLVYCWVHTDGLLMKLCMSTKDDVSVGLSYISHDVGDVYNLITDLVERKE